MDLLRSGARATAHFDLVHGRHRPQRIYTLSCDAGADALFESADKGGEGLWAGSQLALVAGFQAISGARATFVGGVELFSDEFVQKEVAT